MLLLFQSVQYNMPWYSVRPNGWISAADDRINRLLPPLRSETSILSSLASAQYRRFVVWSIVSPFGQPRFPVTMLLLDEPSMAACSIFGFVPQSVQYIVLNKNNETIHPPCRMEHWEKMGKFQNDNTIGGEVQLNVA